MKYTGVLQDAPVAVIEHGDDLRITGWNRGAERMFGYSWEEAVGRSLDLLILRGKDSEAWRQHAREGGDAPSIWACVRKDGSAVMCEWVHQLARDGQDAPAGAVCFGRDVTAEVRQEQLLRVLTENLPLSVWAVDPQGILTAHAGKDAAAGSIFELYPDMAPRIRQALEGERSYWSAEVHGAHEESWIVPIRGDRGDVTAVIGVTLDVSKSKNMEQYLRGQLDLVRRQQQVLRDLSTAIIEVWDNVVALPMVGVVEGARTAAVMSTLLDAVVRTRARFAILDLTGVEAVDTETAAYLIELVRAVRLLGAEGIVTGIRPKVAQTVVTLGLDLSSIITLSNLRAGLRYCIAQMSSKE